MKPRAIAFAFILLCTICRAAEVKLKNGTSVQGTIGRFVPAQVEIKTARGSVFVPADSLSKSEQEKIPELKVGIQRESDLLRRIQDLEAVKRLTETPPKIAQPFQQDAESSAVTSIGTAKLDISVQRSKTGIVAGKKQTMNLYCSDSDVAFFRHEDGGLGDISREFFVKIDHAEVPKFQAVLQKFTEWEKLAGDKKVDSFSKPLGEVGTMSYDFTWTVTGPLSVARIDPLKNCSSGDVRWMLELLEELPGAQKELAEKIATETKKLEAFK